MKVMVTGATGFVGSHAVEALLAAGHEVRLLARSEEKIERVLGRRGIHVGEWVRGDTGDAGAVSDALRGCDAVLHAAAAFSGDGRVVAANAHGTRTVLRGACELGLDPIVHVSSISALFPPHRPVLRVDDPVGDPTTPYGRSKAESEHVARALQAAGAPVVTIYPSAVYGPHDPGPGDGTKALRDCLRWAWPEASTGISIVDVRDLAGIVVAVMEAGRGPRRYMAGGRAISWSAQGDLCERLTGRRLRRMPTPPFLLRLLGGALDLVRLAVSIDYPLSYDAALMMDQKFECDSRATLEELAVGFRPLEETFADCLRWLAETGHIGARHAGRLAPAPAPPGSAGVVGAAPKHPPPDGASEEAVEGAYEA